MNRFIWKKIIKDNKNNKGNILENLIAELEKKGKEQKRSILDSGQILSLRNIICKLQNNGVILADEVGMGKTRIAVALARAVIEAGGRVAVIIPPGLGYQWKKEFAEVGLEEVRPILRSLSDFYSAWKKNDEWNNDNKPWHDEKIVMISHLFDNWRLGKNTYRRLLLPDLYAKWYKLEYNRFPLKYKRLWNDAPKYKETIQQVSDSILNTYYLSLRKGKRKEFCDVMEEISWKESLDTSEYGKNGNLRPTFEKIVGLGLGFFDLVIIDEAHKNKSVQGKLSELLDTVIWRNVDSRSLAMTATPLELDNKDWGNILSRIQVEENERKTIISILDDYVLAVKDVQNYCYKKEYQERYFACSKAYFNALEKYLFRRDKRQEKAVQDFLALLQKNQEGYVSLHSYRNEEEIKIETKELSLPWKKSICAAEALSFVKTNSNDKESSLLKRLRLYFANGHGIASLMGDLNAEVKDDEKQQAEDEKLQEGVQEFQENFAEKDDPQNSKKDMERIRWWHELLLSPYDKEEKNSQIPLCSQPTILAAVEKIEEVCQQGEKVLVFGRFTLPMQALTNLLNARHIVRYMDNYEQNKHNGHFLPFSKINEKLVPFISIAYNQLESKLKNPIKEINDAIITDINKKLDTQYKKLVKQRESRRENLLEMIDEGVKIKIKKTGKDKTEEGQKRKKELLKYQKIFSYVKEKIIGDVFVLSMLTEAIHEMLDSESPAEVDFANAFIDLVTAIGVKNEEEDADMDEMQQEKFLKEFQEILKSEYGGQQAQFAKLIYGETKDNTRRLYQEAFNRKSSSLNVLVAQSMVGREGLNLHKACRTVILLHPEWNPGVVEQQIGRVDRRGSLWEKKFREYEKLIQSNGKNGEIPKINFYPVVFSGTYDEYNWSVLRERWATLSSQLHGIIIDPTLERYKELDCEKLKNEISKINNNAPDFSPTKKRINNKLK